MATARLAHNRSSKQKAIPLVLIGALAGAALGYWLLGTLGLIVGALLPIVGVFLVGGLSGAGA